MTEKELWEAEKDGKIGVKLYLHNDTDFPWDKIYSGKFFGLENLEKVNYWEVWVYFPREEINQIDEKILQKQEELRKNFLRNIGKERILTEKILQKKEKKERIEKLFGEVEKGNVQVRGREGRFEKFSF